MASSTRIVQFRSVLGFDVVQLEIDVLGDGTVWENHGFPLTKISEDETDAEMQDRIQKGLQDAADDYAARRIAAAPPPSDEKSLEEWLGKTRVRKLQTTVRMNAEALAASSEASAEQEGEADA